jgi:bifunctional non-homologous end joining protein LigD
MVGARRAPLLGFVEPSLALLVDKPPTGPQWAHEIKFDGYRIQARIDGDDIRLLTRKALDWTKRFPTIAGGIDGVALRELVDQAEHIPDDRRALFVRLPPAGSIEAYKRTGISRRPMRT